MTTIAIKDLQAAQELDRKAMSAVRGGRYWAMPYYGLPSFDSSKHDFAFNASQVLAQNQDVVNMNGNNVAFASGITSTVNPTQNGTNTIVL